MNMAFIGIGAAAASPANYSHAAAGAINHLIVVPLSKPRTLGLRGFPPLSRLHLLQKIPIHRHRHHSATYRTTTALISSSSSSATTTTDVIELGDDSTLPTDVSSSSWVEFAGNVSGEWDGYEAEFSTEGKPIELPESVVPEAYREWEVKVLDWQTQCPTLARTYHNEKEECLLFYKSIRLLPTVGCEADAATRYSVDERTIINGGLPADNTSYYCGAFAYQSSGCYVAVWVKDRLLLELEHCLVDPQNRESRVRIVQRVRLDDHHQSSTDKKKKKLILENVKVCCEQWYGSFRNGEQLGGCAIRDSAFASTDALKASQLAGVWQQGRHAVASFQNSPPNNKNIHQELVAVEDSVGKMRVTEEHEINNSNYVVVLLPKQLWCWVEEREDGETWCEVGWLLDHGRAAITSKCIFSPHHTQLKEIVMAQERKLQ